MNAFQNFSLLFKNSTKHNWLSFFIKYENFSHLLCPLQILPHPLERNALLSDSLEMGLLAEKSHCKIIVCKFCSLGVVIGLFGRLQSGNYILRHLIVPAFSFCSPPQPPCSVIMGATFKVESTFKLSRQTRMLTGL